MSEKRRQAAAQLDWKVMEELPPLKMEKARFVTRIERLQESSWSENGVDSVAFTVSTNPNSPQGPLNKIASGGELARFMLALKVNLAKTGGCQTMILTKWTPVSAARRHRRSAKGWRGWRRRCRC